MNLLSKKNLLVNLTLLSGFLFLSLTASSISAQATVSSPTIESFDFTLLDGSIESLSTYAGKPVILEWAASWCVTCEDTQLAMKELYPLYKDSVHFISLSYGGSGDTLEKFAGMKSKGAYQWIFALDHTNFASTIPIGPGSMWILDSSLGLNKDWQAVILTSTDIQNALNPMLIVDQQQELINPGGGTPGRLPLDNPLFIGFGVFVIGMVLLIITLKIKSTKVANVDQEVMKNEEKTSQQLTELKTMLSKDQPKKSKTVQKNKHTRQRRSRR